MAETATVERGATVTFGHPQTYGGTPPTGTWVTIEGEAFIEYRGALYTVCGWCDPAHPGVKGWYGHVDAGVCYQCLGSGIRKRVGPVEEAVKIVRRRQRDRARRAAKAEARIAAAAAEAEAWRAAHPELAARLAAIADEAGESETATYAVYETYGDFLVGLAQQSQFRPLSEAQAEAVAEALARHEEQAAAQVAKVEQSRYLGATGEKVTVSGQVVVRSTHEVQAGYSTRLALLLVIDGVGEFHGVHVKTFGSGQSLWEVGRGDMVTITGTVKDHAEYEGVRQTVLTRAKVVIDQRAETEEDAS